MAAEKRQPWMKWYPADWRADPALRMCSFAAQGLWIAMLGVMHEAEPYGHLLVNGRAPTARQLSGLLGGTEKEIAGLLQELDEAGVFSRDDEGVIYSRRMVRDKAKADADRENGKRGGNPKLSTTDKPPNKPEGKPRKETGGLTEGDKAQRPEARGQMPEEESTATAEHVAARPEPPAGPDRDAIAVVALADQEFQAAFRETARAWPAPLDKAIARQWLDAGATPDLIRSVVAAQSAKLRAKGRACPVSLKFLDRDVREAIFAAKPAETSPATPRPSQREAWERHGNRAYWEDTIQGYVARPDRGWPAGIGAPPDEAGYIGPPDLAMTTAEMAERRKLA